jgi:hypothetical protein
MRRSQSSRCSSVRWMLCVVLFTLPLGHVLRRLGPRS